MGNPEIRSRVDCLHHIDDQSRVGLWGEPSDIHSLPLRSYDIWFYSELKSHIQIQKNVLQVIRQDILSWFLHMSVNLSSPKGRFLQMDISLPLLEFPAYLAMFSISTALEIFIQDNGYLFIIDYDITQKNDLKISYC